MSLAVDSVGRYVRTVARLAPAQVFHRLRLRAQRPLFEAMGERILASRLGPIVGSRWPEAYRPTAARLSDEGTRPEEMSAGEFSFLNVRRALARDSRTEWSPEDVSQLWRYHLHYFDWAWSFARHPDHTWARDAFLELWRSWQGDNPVGRWDAWSPYVASIRTWNFCALYRGLVQGSDADDGFRRQIALHGRFLEWHLERDVGGNHLIKNLKGLVGAAVFLADEPLLAKTLRLLGRQIAEQVLADGGHYELSPSYHCQVLEDFIDIRSLLAAHEVAIPLALDDALFRMRSWLGMILMPDGDVPLFNDSWLIGSERLQLLEPGPRPTRPLTVLGSSGYVVARPSEGCHLVVDVGAPCPEELPAHAHADCLSFELAIDGQRVIVDSGTSTYQDMARRAYERSTKAHNTVELDGLDQTEVWGSFRAGRRALGRLDVARQVGDTLEIEAHHDGYAHRPGAPRHTRRWRVTKDDLSVTDEVEGEGAHLVRSYLHFSPGLDLKVSGHGTAAVGPLTVTTTAGLTSDPSLGVVAQRFGSTLQGSCLVASLDKVLPVRIETRMSWLSP